MILDDSARFCSYTFVPATSLSKFKRSFSFRFVMCEIYLSQQVAQTLKDVWTDSALRDNVVRIAFREARTLQEIHDFCLAR